MTEAINAHKKMAMGMTEGNVMKKGGSVKKYASGGSAILGPNITKKDKEIMESPMKKENSSVQKTKSGGRVNMKKGSMAKKPGIMIAIAIPKKGSSRGR